MKHLRYLLPALLCALLLLLTGCASSREYSQVTDTSKVAVVKGKMGSFLLDAYDNATVIIHEIEGGRRIRGLLKSGFHVQPGRRAVMVQLSGPYYEERYTVAEFDFEAGHVYRFHGSIGFKDPSVLQFYDETDPAQPLLVAQHSFRD